MRWIGYKAQLTETCDPACKGPHLITNVETTPATTPDDNRVAVVHASLERRGLLPGEHLVDKGYTDSHVLVDGPRRYGVTIVGPVAAGTGWQASVEGGLTKAAFKVDWEREVVTCPAGTRRVLKGFAVDTPGFGRLEPSSCRSQSPSGSVSRALADAIMPSRARSPVSHGQAPVRQS